MNLNSEPQTQGERGLKKAAARAMWFALLNGFLAMAVVTRVLPYMSNLREPLAAFYVTLAFFGHFTILSLIFTGVPSFPLALPGRFGRARGAAAALLATFLVGLLYADTVVYANYRFHMKGFVADLLLGGAGGEIFSFSTGTKMTALMILGALAAAEWGFWRLSGVFSSSRGGVVRGLVLISAALVSMIAAQGIHIWADAAYYTPVTAQTRHIPLYQALTAKRFLANRGLADIDLLRRENQAKWRGKGNLNYPTSPLAFNEPVKKKNVIFLVMECFRTDVFEGETTPNLRRFANRPEVTRYQNHWSGGNSTAAGIFSLFYGLPGSYYKTFAEEQVPPVLIDRFMKTGYDIGVFSSARITSPPLDRTVFAGVDNLRTITEGHTAYVRDAKLVKDWEAFLDQRKGDKPFFGFIFFDSPHAYDFPPDYPLLFQPVATDMNYLESNKDLHRTELFNLFRTAMHYADTLAGRVLDDLDRRGLLNDTVIVVTSDHAEEFNDNRKGYWGHIANYSRWQTKVPLFIYRPGEKGGAADRMTSHLDIAPTVMEEVLGTSSPPESYSSGENLKNSRAADGVIMASYYDYALVTPDRIITFEPEGTISVTDGELNPLTGYQVPPETIKKVLFETSRFLK